MADYLADHQIRASLNAQKRLRIYNPSLDDVEFFFEDNLILLPAQEITELPYAEGLVAANTMVDYLLNKRRNDKLSSQLQIDAIRKEVLV